MKHGVLIVVLTAIAFVLMGCSSAETAEDSNRKGCLYAAVEIYPTWNETNGPVIENLQECKTLSVQDRNELRSMLSAFVAKANERMKKEG